MSAALVDAVVANSVIALLFLSIGLYVAPKFVFAAPHGGARLARWSGMTFFVMCAMTHLELVAHAFSEGETALNSPTWLDTWHGLIVHNAQALAGTAFLFLSIHYLAVRIYNRAFYTQLLDRRVADIEAEISARRTQPES